MRILIIITTIILSTIGQAPYYPNHWYGANQVAFEFLYTKNNNFSIFNIIA